MPIFAQRRNLRTLYKDAFSGPTTILTLAVFWGIPCLVISALLVLFCCIVSGQRLAEMLPTWAEIGNELLLLATIVIVVGAIVSFFIVLGNVRYEWKHDKQSEQSITEFLTLLNHHDFDSAYRRCSAKLQSELSFLDFKKLIHFMDKVDVADLQIQEFDLTLDPCRSPDEYFDEWDTEVYVSHREKIFFESMVFQIDSRQDFAIIQIEIDNL